MPDKTSSPDIWEITRRMHNIIDEYTKLIISQYKAIRGFWGSSTKTMMDTIGDFIPDDMRHFFETFDMWLDGEMQVFAKYLEESLDEYAKLVSSLEFTAPDTERYKRLLEQHTGLWVENYLRLKEQREQVSLQSLEAVKTMFTPAVHPVLDIAFRWIAEQNDRLEEAILDKIKRYALAPGQPVTSSPP
jgi:hypothetical protein